jgi:hypothetical protein
MLCIMTFQFDLPFVGLGAIGHIRGFGISVDSTRGCWILNCKTKCLRNGCETRGYVEGRHDDVDDEGENVEGERRQEGVVLYRAPNARP